MEKIVLLLLCFQLFTQTAIGKPLHALVLNHEEPEEELLLPPSCETADVYLLDSTYSYLSAGSPGQWNLNERDIFTYNTQAWETGYINYLRNAANTGWNNNKKYTHTYNANGYLIQRLRQDWNGTNWVNKYLYTNSFNTEGLRILSTRSDWTGTGWTQAVKYTYTYNNANLLTLRIRQIWSGTAWVNDKKYVYTYDANGYRIKNEVSIWNATLNAWVLSYKYDYINDTQGKVLSRIKSLWTGGNWVEDSKTDYSYDANNNRSQWIKYLKVGALWVEDSKKDYYWSFYNAAPTDITLSDSLFNQGDPIGTVVGTFSTTDTDDTNHTYSLVAGDGTNDQDNNLFSISGNQLLLNANFAGLPGPFYIFVLTNDGRGGYFCKAFVIYSCTPFVFSAELNNPSCPGYCNGAIQITQVQNGTPPYSYTWNTGATTNGIAGLCQGAYVVTLTDLIGCTSSANFSLSDPPALSLTLSATDESCNNCNDGTASASANGGTPPYAFLWSNGDTTASISNLTPGTYSLTLTDANACEREQNIEIGEYSCPILSLFYTANTLMCYGDCDGSISIDSISGGTAPFSYAWSTGDSTAEISGLCAAAYFVTITDAKNCKIAQNFTLSEADELLSNLSTDNANCPTCADGSAQVMPTGGFPPYQLLWSTGETSASIENLMPGDYSISITDSIGCTLVDTFLIYAECTDFGISSVEITHYTEASKGSIDIELTGGSLPYTYSWTDSLGQTISTEQDVSNLSPGCYQLEVEDAAGCFLDSTFCIEDLTVSSGMLFANFSAKLYPNPVSETDLYINLPKGLAKAAELQFELLWPDGKRSELFASPVNEEGIWRIHLPSSLPAGLYILRLTRISQGSQSLLFIKL